MTLLAATVVGVLLVLQGLVDLGVDESAISLIAVGTSAVVAVRSLDMQRRLERERQLGERRDKMIESYRDVYDQALQGEAPSEVAMRRFNVDLTFYGDEDLIKAWLGMRRVAAEGGHRPAHILPAQMKLVRAMRRSLGHQDKALTDMDLFGVVMSDPDELEEILATDNRDTD